MGKKNGSGGGGGGSKRSSGDSQAAWSEDHHAVRKAKRQRKMDTDKQMERERRSALLTRDSKEKHEAGKLKLHIKRVQRQIDNLRQRLEAWDDVEEARLAKKAQQREEAERKDREDERAGKSKPKRGRLGPETWKLKGAARPAWQVYDFDTRYVDPYIKAHEEAREKVARSRNIMVLGKGRFGEEDSSDHQAVPQPQCREFLALLMQLGNLAMQANQLKTARAAFLECIDLDSIKHPITPARCQLVRLYMEANRPDSARRLCERIPTTDPSVWIRYSAALIEFVSWKILEEEGSTRQTAELHIIRAIKANVFCAYYLAFHDTFEEVMDYVDEIEGADESSPLLEAIEYCNSEQYGAWRGTDDALDWVKGTLLRVLNGDSITVGDGILTPSDLDWRVPLARVRENHPQTEDNKAEDVDVEDEEGDDQDSDAGSVVDVAMFTGMFETGMEMLEVSGLFNGSKKVE